MSAAFDEAALAEAASAEWALDPDWITLNNGSYGACPRSVRAAEQAFRDRLDAQPTRFLHHEAPALIRAAAVAVAARFGVPAGRLALVENATAGVNAVLRSRTFAPADEILVLDHAYGAVLRAIEFVARRAGAAVVRVAVPFERPDPAALVARVAGAITPRTRLAVLDHVTSGSALVLPVARMAAACRDRGVPVLVDAAHAPGMIPLDLAAVGADWTVGNLHKWMFAPGGTGFLHAVHPDRDDLHPVSISHGLGQGLAAEFDWTGTRDFSGWLAIPAALALHDRLGGAALMARNADLAVRGALLVAEAIGTMPGPVCVPGGAMALVALPERAGATPEDAARLRARLIEARIDTPVASIAGGLWLRLSFAACTRIEDAERLAARLPALLSG